VVKSVPTLASFVGFCTVTFRVALALFPPYVYVTFTGTSPTAVLAEAEVTVTVAEVVLLRVTFELVVLQL